MRTIGMLKVALIVLLTLSFLAVPGGASASGLGQLSGVAQFAGSVQPLGYGHTCVLVDASPNHGLKCWGYNDEGQLGDGTTVNKTTPVPVFGLSSGVAAVAQSWHHSCALLNTGAVKCWGDNTFGDLGDGTTTQRLTPVNVVGLSSGVIAIASSSDNGNRNGVQEEAAGHTCALKADGSVWCWGLNIHGQLGTGTNVGPDTCEGFPCSRVPQQVCVTYATQCTQHLSGATAVSAGGSNACALISDGGVRCWGLNSIGQLGTGSISGPSTCFGLPCSPVAVAVTGLGGAAQSITSGGGHSCSIVATPISIAKCWGSNFFGELGWGVVASGSPTPVKVCESGSGSGCPALTNVAAIGAGLSYHTCALIAVGTGRMKCWGINAWGQLGIGLAAGSSDEYLPKYVLVAGQPLEGVTGIAVGYTHTCARTTQGGLACWGANGYGQLGDGSGISEATCQDYLVPPERTSCMSTPQTVVGNVDSDGDGCSDDQELGLDEITGGQRDPASPWDFYDVWAWDGTHWRRDHNITLFDDYFGVAYRFGAHDMGGTASVNRDSNPLIPPFVSNTTGYHPAFDRSPAQPGADPWDLGPPDGEIDLFTDILDGVAQQINHTCN